ncbi:MAG: DUF5060 domain-containing protein [Opitutales bacterium]
MMPSHLFRRFLPVFLLLAAVSSAGGPVTFSFVPPARPEIRNPFARELWGEVVTPSGRKLLLPAYYAGDNVFAVRARPDETGTYRFGEAAETTAGLRQTGLYVTLVSPREVEVRSRTRLPAVGRDPGNRTGFLRADGRPFVPVGANLAWPAGDGLAYYQQAIPAFARANLNWMRVWMVSWGQLNLDWLPEWAGPSPRPGGLDARVAANWDGLLATAEEQGVYVQMVFQHHGQLTTGANSNWAENPWNAANPGGFLHTPTEFFTSPNARLMTMLKYRYIIARWGWSPAVFAWELFNEVHWVDAIDREKNEAAVADWHSVMAGYIRSVDVYGHLLTTSTDNLRSPIYAQMDFYQPHLYSADLLGGARHLPPSAGPLDRPVFYGEYGDDHLDVSAAAKKAGVAMVPPAWAGLMGESRLPAQPWVGAGILATGRTQELGAIARFVARTRFASQDDLQPFTAAMESDRRVPLVLTGGQVWQRRAAPELEVPLDGRLPAGFADIPRIYAGWPGSLADGFPDRATYHFDFPRATTLRARFVGAGSGGAAIRFLLDGAVVAEKTWPAQAAGTPTPEHPQELAFPVAAGHHTLVVRNPGNADWVDVAGLDLGFDTSALAAVGQRNARFIALWVWHREGIFAAAAPAAVSGRVLLDEVPAGVWTVTWWDTLKGEPAGPPETLTHAGGRLSLPTPPIARHAAVVLVRAAK